MNRKRRLTKPKCKRRVYHTLTLPFVMHMMASFLPARLFLNHEFHRSYMPMFLKQIRWHSNQPLNPKWIPLVSNMDVFETDMFGFTKLNCLLPNPCSSLTSLYVDVILEDYSVLTHYTTLRSLHLHLGSQHPILFAPSSLTNLSLYGTTQYDQMEWHLPHLQVLDCTHVTMPLPDSSALTSLIFAHSGFSLDLPSTLLSLKLQSFTDEILLRKLPSSVTKLEMVYVYDDTNPWPLLPSKLSVLRLNASNYRYPVVLPMHLTELEVGNVFNSEIVFYPPSLKKIVFGHAFNQPIRHLPSNLEELELGYLFTKDIPSFDELLTLRLYCKFVSYIGDFPKLQYLKIIFTDVWKHFTCLPLSLKRLDIRHCINEETLSIVPFSTFVIVNRCDKYQYVRMRCGICIDEEFSCQNPS
jgi:hypothetical protein